MVFILIPPPLFPAIVLVMLFSSSFLPFSAALSAAVALSSNQFLLSSLALSFTSFSLPLYSSLYRCSSPSNLAPSILSFASFPSWIVPQVLSPVHGLLSFFDLPITFSAASLYVTKILSCFLWIFYISYRCKPVLHFNVISPPDLFTLQLTHVKSHTCFLLPMRLCQL